MDLLSNTNDILFTFLGLAPLILASVLVPVALRRRERITPLLQCVSNRTYAFIIAGAFVLMAGVCSLLHFKVDPFGDDDLYFVRALNIIECGVFGYGQTPIAYFPPGYSFILLPAAITFGSSRWAFFLTNMTLLVGISVWTRFVLIRLGIASRPANLVSLIIVLYPNRLLSTLTPASDIPFSLVYLCAFLFMTLGILYPERWRYPLLVGVTAGIASLVRATGLPLMIPLAAGLWCSNAAPRRLRLRNAGVMVASMFVVLIPWTVRNALLFGTFAPVSDNFGVNLAIGNNPSNSVTHNRYVDSVWSDPGAWRAVGGSRWNEAERDSYLARQGVQYIREHPVRFLYLGGLKVFHTLASDASSFGTLETCTNARLLVFSAFPGLPPKSPVLGILHAVYSTGYRTLFIVNNTVYYSGIILVLFALYRHRRRLAGPEVAYLFVALIACALAFVLFGLSRYKEPLPPLTVLLVALAAFHPRVQ